MSDELLRQHLREVPPHRALLRSVECRLMGSVELQPPVLDVGCGDGQFAARAYHQPLDVGIDLPQAELDEARSWDAYRWVVSASGTALPFPDGSFRTVVSNSVLEHIPDLDAALREIARILAPGGTLAFTTPSEHFGEFLLGNALLRRLGGPGLGQAYVRWFDRISAHYHRLSPQAWREKLDALGFEVRHWRYYFSRAAHRAFDFSHYIGAPTLLFHRLTGRWIPTPVFTQPLEPWLRPYVCEEPLEAGAYLFFVCEKKTSG